ncbi:alpha/beta hydrolase [Candidatus Saccharibacteria bacterium]|nr:alpha/beta hydrolase [Candidatus Saccharibacteria bacterium]
MTAKKIKSVKDFGGSGNVIILLHGFLSSSKYWNHLQPSLTDEGYRVIAIDLLGFGNAPKPRYSTYSYQEHIAHLDVVFEQLKLDKPFILIGHSMGALLATRYAVLHPDRVSSLALLHPPLYKDIEETRKSLRQTGRLYRFLLDSKYRHFGWALIKTFAFYHIAKHSQISRERSMKNVIEVSEIFGDLEKVETKTLLLMGLKDRPEYNVNIKTAQLSNSVKVITKNVSHHSPAKKPLIIQKTILDFISQ